MGTLERLFRRRAVVAAIRHGRDSERRRGLGFGPVFGGRASATASQSQRRRPDPDSERIPYGTSCFHLITSPQSIFHAKENRGVFLPSLFVSGTRGCLGHVYVSLRFFVPSMNGRRTESVECFTARSARGHPAGLDNVSWVWVMCPRWLLFFWFWSCLCCCHTTMVFICLRAKIASPFFRVQCFLFKSEGT